MTPEEFDALFDQFHSTAFRWEGLPAYDVGGEEAVYIEAMRSGAPVPERSVRTDPWIARIAITTVAGKDWSRLRVVDDPLTEYERFELAAYTEAQVVGDRTSIVRRADVAPGLDFWLFDGGRPEAYAVVMRYDDDGHWLGADLTTEPGELDELDRRRKEATAAAIPLNVFMATTVARG